MERKQFFGWPFRTGVLAGALLATIGAAGVFLLNRPNTPPTDVVTVGPEPAAAAIVTLKPYGGGVIMDGQEVSRDQFIGRLTDKLRLADKGIFRGRLDRSLDRKLAQGRWSAGKLAGTHHYPLVR